MNTFKKLTKRLSFRIWLITAVIFVTIAVIANIVILNNLFIYNTFNSMFGGGSLELVSGDPSQYKYYTADYANKADTLAAANALNERIAEEGIVLLKNDDSLPLAAGNKISVFGKNSADLVYGGSGSGGSSSAGAPTIADSLTAAGFIVNPTLKEFYENDSKSGSGRAASPAMGAKVAGFGTGETPQESYTQKVKDSYADYADAAVVVISRIGGEGFDLPRSMKTSYADNAQTIAGARSKDDHYLQLDNNEADLIKAAGSAFANVIVVINCSTPMELGFLDDPTHYAYSPNVKGALWIGTPGKTGVNALGRVLNGDVNPSGRTVDTYARDFKADPTWSNFGNNNTSNGNRYTVNGKNKGYYYVDYEEGIYVGYRYYETRGYDEQTRPGGDADWYAKNVVYPLGYGLSYDADFSWELIGESTLPTGSVLSDDSEITVGVRVTNNSERAGKDVVQLYCNAPYYENGIEKSHVVLLDFGKTKLLEKGESDVITFGFKPADMASYDYAGNGCWTLDGGEYNIYIGRNAHQAWSGDALTCTYYVPAAGYKYETDAKTGNKVENRFDAAGAKIKTYLSRGNWAGTMPAAPTDAERSVTDAFIDSLEYKVEDEGKKWEATTTPTQSRRPKRFADTAVKLYELREKAFDDDMWETLLDQLTVEEMAQLIGTGNYNTMAIMSIGKPKTIDPDGPVGFTMFMGEPCVYDTCFYASGCVVAATYNTELAYEMGKMIGNEGIIGYENGDKTPYSGWYAPAVNIHRSPFSGRNWEYYSEDGILSGKIASGVIRGAKAKGVYTYVKHFALNDQETNRTDGGLITWANEQSMRELYFRPFELAVKEGGTTAVMSSFNRIGTVWAGGSYELLTEVLRDEWGFRGMVVTDFNLYSHMPADQMIRAGGDLNLSPDKQPSLIKTPTQLTAIRKAAHNILYTVVNSNAMNGYGAGVEYRYTMPLWVVFMILIDVVLACASAVSGFLVVRMCLKNKKNAPDGTETPAVGKGDTH